MALSIGQLSLDSYYSALLPGGAPASSLGSALRSQFYGQQASQILNRASSDTRVQLYQEALSSVLQLERSTHPFRSDPGYMSVLSERTFSSSDDSLVRGYTRRWATPRSFEIEVFSVGEGPGATTYSVDNGATQSADSTEIVLHDGAVVLELVDTTSEPVTITVAPDTTDIEHAIEALAASWNSALSTLTQNPSELTTPLAARLNRAAGTIESRLGQLGITRDADGLLELDSDTLQAAIADNLQRVDDAIQGPAGLAATSYSIARDFLTAPHGYVTHPQNPVEEAALRWTTYHETRGLLVDTMG